MSTSGSQKMYRAVSSFASQFKDCQDEFERCLQSLDPLFRTDVKFRRVVVCAMGGSAFPMEILKTRLRGEVPLTIHRDYSGQLTSIDPKTLYLLVSFSGNTEEVLSCGEFLLEANAHLCGISNGGALTAWCKRNDIPSISFPKLPSEFQPRCAGGYFLGFVARLLDALNITSSLTRELGETFGCLESKRDSIEAQGDRIAMFLDQGPRWILGYSSLADTVGLIARIKLNENAKVVAHYDNLPEFNHNQMVAAVFDKSSTARFLFLERDGIGARESHRLKTCREYISAQGFDCSTLSCDGDSLLEQILFGVWVMDFASLKLAERLGVDPLSIASIETFKKQLKA